MIHIFTALFAVSCITVDVKDDDDDDNNWVDDDGWSSEEDDPVYNADDDGDDDGGGDGDGSSDDGGDDDGSGDDGGGSGSGVDVDAAWTSPACDYTGVVCMALTGPAWSAAPLADICTQFDDGYADQLGGIASTPVDGCPEADATGACGLPAVGGQAGTEQVWFSYPAFDGQGSCNANGGTWVAL